MPVAIVSFIARALLISKIVRFVIVTPVLFFITEYIQNEVLNLLAGVAIPVNVLVMAKYFYIDKCVSIVLTFFQLKGYVKWAKIWLQSL